MSEQYVSECDDVDGDKPYFEVETELYFSNVHFDCFGALGEEVQLSRDDVVRLAEQLTVWLQASKRG